MLVRNASKMLVRKLVGSCLPSPTRTQAPPRTHPHTPLVSSCPQTLQQGQSRGAGHPRPKDMLSVWTLDAETTSGSHRGPVDSHGDAAADRRLGTAVGSPVTQMVTNLPAVQETRLRSLSQEDPLEESMAAHATILAWRMPWTEEPGGLQSGL